MSLRSLSSEFSEEDEYILLLFARQAAVAMENARLHEHVQELAIIQERERIAREMHDSLGQVLGYVNTKIQAIQALVKHSEIATASTYLEQLKGAAQDAYADVREGILGLRLSNLANRGLLEVLKEYTEHFTHQAGIQTELLVEGEVGEWSLSPLAEVQILRIVQEALTNVRKHSHANRAWVRFSSANGRRSVVVEDNGRGFNPLRVTRGEWPHLGLQSMRERAEAIGAIF